MSVDGTFLALLALADLAFLAYLRRRHGRQVRRERVADSLRLYLQRESLNDRHQKNPIHQVPRFPAVMRTGRVILT